MVSALNEQRINHLKDNDAYETPEVHHLVAPGLVLDSAGDVAHEGNKPLKWAIENLEGDTVIEAGSYIVGKVDRAPGGTFMARSPGTVVLPAMAGGGDTMAMMDGNLIEPLIFRGLEIHASSRSAWITEDSTGPYPVSWEDCLIDGRYDHALGQGAESKWGFVPHRWSGYAARCEFKNIRREHGIYAHTLSADGLLYECRFRRCGRTGFQHVGRNDESGFSDHELLVTGCLFEDNGLRDGGSSLTAQGIREVYVERSQFFIGRDRNFRDKYMDFHPEKPVFSTGHIVNWSESNRNDPTELFTLDDVLTFSAEGDGRAASIQIKNTLLAAVRNQLHVDTGYNDHAIELKEGTHLLLAGTAWWTDGEVVWG